MISWQIKNIITACRTHGHVHNDLTQSNEVIAILYHTTLAEYTVVSIEQDL